MPTNRKIKTARRGVPDSENVTARINGKFAPGQSGNPAGRPKVTPDEIALLDRIKSLSDKAVAALESVLDDAKAPADAKIKAANIVIERQLGKPRQEIDSTVTQNQATPSEHRPDLTGIRQRVVDQAAFEQWKAQRDAAAGKGTEPEQLAETAVIHH